MLQEGSLFKVGAFFIMFQPACTPDTNVELHWEQSLTQMITIIATNDNNAGNGIQAVHFGVEYPM
jgi:hypothetical protein